MAKKDSSDTVVTVVLVAGGIGLGLFALNKLLTNPAEEQAKNRFKFWVKEYEKEYVEFTEDESISQDEQNILDFKEEQITIWFERLKELGIEDDVIRILGGLGLAFILIKSVPDIIKAIRQKNPPKKPPGDIPPPERQPVGTVQPVSMPVSEVTGLNRLGIAQFSPSVGAFYLKPFNRPIRVQRDFVIGQPKRPVPITLVEFDWLFAATAIVFIATVAVFAPALTPVILIV